MKICPFISHMIGEGQAGVLEMQDDVARPDAARLFCMKEACRFHQSDVGECSFDVAFEQVRRQSEANDGDKPLDAAVDKVARDIEKLWSFQTKSVAEMIESIGESDKKSSEAFERFERETARKLEEAVGEGISGILEQLREDVATLRETAQTREEGMEDLLNTISEMVMNFEDRVSELRQTSSKLVERVDKLEQSVPRGDDLRKWIEDSIEPRDDDTVSDDVRSLKEQIAAFVESSSRIEEEMRGWQERMDSRVEEIRDGQGAWKETLEELSARKAEEQAAEEDENESPSAEDAKKARKLNNLGVTSFHNGELVLARDQFEEAVALDPGFAECYNNLGLVYTELGEEEQATTAFGTAIKLNPDLHAAYSNLGYVFYKQGSYDQAVEMYNEALGRCASNTSAYTNLGNAYFKQGKRDEARKAWEKAVELDPSNRKASRSLKELEREMV